MNTVMTASTAMSERRNRMMNKARVAHIKILQKGKVT